MITGPASLGVSTPGDSEVVVTRSFSAPRQLVFDAHTKPDLVRRWLLGPPGWTMAVCDIDLRVGGRYRYAWKGPAGASLAMGGVFRAIVAPERVISTERFDGDESPGETVDTMVLTESDGFTTLTLTVRYPSPAARAGMLAAGMTEGLAAGYARLDEVVAALAARGG